NFIPVIIYNEEYKI
uniref:Uncharacterized protein n=1 Tax=Castor canadensis TaxID=51338 RepID=A0A8C0VTB6_CASCN